MGEYIGLVPPKEGFVQTEKFNFARFAEGPNYKRVNRNLVERVFNLLPGQEIVALDVAMGHGMVPRLAADILDGTNRRLYMIGVDLDPYAIDQARKQIRNTGECGFIFLRGDARDLKNVSKDYINPGEVHYTSIHDAIHEIRDDRVKKEVVDNMVMMLKGGGYLSYNSAFTTEAMGMEWGVWLLNFLKISGAKRDKNIQVMPVHSPGEYRKLTEDAGLTIIHDEKVEVHMSIEELMGISEYPPFARGFTESLVFTRPVSLEEGIDLIKQAILPTLDKLKKASITRFWHEMIAQKPTQ